MFSSVLIVCVGNICRSPMGEYLFSDKLAARGVDVSVASAGIGALVGHGADPHAVTVMAEHGINVGPHRARQLNAELATQYELILVMEEWQRKEIESLYPFARGRVHSMGKWGTGDIGDPYRKPIGAFVEAYEKIEQACDEWCKKVW
ncbi:MAG: low molecular weight protein-tyrosine-phosphatase [Pseudomonadota bacterium]